MRVWNNQGNHRWEVQPNTLAREVSYQWIVGRHLGAVFGEPRYIIVGPGIEPQSLFSLKHKPNQITLKVCCCMNKLFIAPFFFILEYVI
ncbi:hypothetical protein DWB84_06820 [Saccharophagus sp. K07]|nr:hypothetical protein [Saccharophagus sp. K07]